MKGEQERRERIVRIRTTLKERGREKREVRKKTKVKREEKLERWKANIAKI